MNIGLAVKIAMLVALSWLQQGQPKPDIRRLIDGNIYEYSWPDKASHALQQGQQTTPTTGTNIGWALITSCDGNGNCRPSKEPPAPTLTVVPAIQEKYVTHHKGDGFACGIFEWCLATEDMHDLRWTCADKKNILLTSEDGTDHYCLKVN